MIVFAGGVRGPCLPVSLCHFHHGAAAILEPVEEALRLGSISTLMPSLCQRYLGGELILCGHSFGTSMVCFFAMQLTVSGLEVRGIVSMDCRSVGIGVDLTHFIPQGLWQLLAPQHVRLVAPQIDYVAPLVPRGHLSTHFSHKAGLAPWQDSEVSECWTWQLLDTDHYDLPNSHVWDMSRSIQR